MLNQLDDPNEKMSAKLIIAETNNIELPPNLSDDEKVDFIYNEIHLQMIRGIALVCITYLHEKYLVALETCEKRTKKILFYLTKNQNGEKSTYFIVIKIQKNHLSHLTPTPLLDLIVMNTNLQNRKFPLVLFVLFVKNKLVLDITLKEMM